MNKDNSKRRLAVIALAISLLIFNFTKITGSDCIRPIHIVTLIGLGVAIGAFILNLVIIIRDKKD